MKNYTHYKNYTLHPEYIGPLSGWFCWIKSNGLTVTKTIARSEEWVIEDAKKWIDNRRLQ